MHDALLFVSGAGGFDINNLIIWTNRLIYGYRNDQARTLR